MLRIFRLPFARSFRRNDQGSVAIIAALLFVMILGLAALALNTGSFYYAKRQQQSATDLAAFAAANNLGAASAAAAASVVSNGIPATAVSNIELGTYVADGSLSPTARFTPQTTSTPNAARVTLQQTKPYIFGNLIALATPATPGASTGLPIVTRSVAATRNAASFGLGSGLASLDGGILNSLFSSLLGSNLSLSAMDYQSLATTNVDLFTFSKALATRANVTAGTYGSLATTTVSLGSAVGAIADASSSSQASAALLNVLGVVGVQPPAIKTSTLIDFGPYGTKAIGSVSPLSASVSALSLMSALIQLADGQNQAATALNVNLPGIISATVKLSVGEPAVGSSLFAIGPTGTTLRTAQTRLLLNLSLVGPAQAPVLNVPLLVTVASGTAVVNSVQCTGTDVTTASVQIGVTPGLAEAWIGTVSGTTLNDFSTALTPSPATLVNILGVLKITAQSHAAIANPNQTSLSFSYTDVSNLTKKTVSTTDYLAPLLSSLFGSAQLNISVLFGLINVPALNLSILQTLAADVAPIDTIVSSVLTGLGVSVGNATTWVSGVQCGQVVFVN